MSNDLRIEYVWDGVHEALGLDKEWSCGFIVYFLRFFLLQDSW